MWLPGHLSNSGQPARLFRRANGEDRGLPLLTTPGKLLVFCCLGRNTALQLNVLEDRIVLGHGDVGLLIFGGLGSSLLLLLLARELLLCGLEVALERARSVFGVVLGSLLCPLCVEIDLVSDTI